MFRTILLASAVSLCLIGKSQTVEALITVECTKCSVLGGDVKQVQGKAEWTKALQPGESIVVIVWPEPITAEQDMTATAVIKGQGYEVTVFQKDREKIFLPVANTAAKK